MTSETLQPKKHELSLGEMNQQNRESYDYLKSLVSEDESPLVIDERTTMRFLKGGKPLRGRLDKIEVTFHNKNCQISVEQYLVCDFGVIDFFVRSEPIALSSGLQIEMNESTNMARHADSGHVLLKEEDKGVRTAAKVIADTVKARIEARETSQP